MAGGEIMATSKAQLKANAKWKEKNKDKQRKYQYRSYAKSYIRKFANMEDLNELLELIEEQKKELNK